MKKTTKQNLFQSAANVGSNAFTGIIDRLRAFSVDDATPVETMLFLEDLQKEIAETDSSIAKTNSPGDLYY